MIPKTCTGTCIFQWDGSEWITTTVSCSSGCVCPPTPVGSPGSGTGTGPSPYDTAIIILPCQPPTVMVRARRKRSQAKRTRK
jgi:hypothetical protein